MRGKIVLKVGNGDWRKEVTQAYICMKNFIESHRF